MAAQRAAIRTGEVRFRPLAELGEVFAQNPCFAGQYAGWIADRSLLNHRKWSPASMAALHVAREAVRDAGWGSADLEDAALVVATSRGNAAGWLGPWPGRRPFRLMAASNSIHSEPCTAISIELGMAGPNHVLASGCSAGLDAVGVAMMMLRSGLAKRALAVAVDLPLVPLLLDQYASSGILAQGSSLDPFHPETSGFIPSEGAAAMAIELGENQGPELLHYACNSDAADPVGIPKDGGRTPKLFEDLPAEWLPTALCPHATGTLVQATAEPAMLARIYGEQRWPDLHLLKPYTGHCIGASGLLESAILAAFMREGTLPGNLANLTAPEGAKLPVGEQPCTGIVGKLAHGMGGHNALLGLRQPAAAFSSGQPAGRSKSGSRLPQSTIKNHGNPP